MKKLKKSLEQKDIIIEKYSFIFRFFFRLKKTGKAMNANLDQIREQCEQYREKVAKLEKEKLTQNTENTFDRRSLIGTLSPSDVLNIECSGTMNTNPKNKMHTQHPSENDAKYKKIINKIMTICSKYCKGKGKCEKLPSTIESLFQKNKLVYDDLRYICDCIGMDCRYNKIDAIGTFITQIKVEHSQMVSRHS